MVPIKSATYPIRWNVLPLQLTDGIISSRCQRVGSRPEVAHVKDLAHSRHFRGSSHLPFLHFKFKNHISSIFETTEARIQPGTSLAYVTLQCLLRSPDRRAEMLSVSLKNSQVVSPQYPNPHNPSLGAWMVLIRMQTSPSHSRLGNHCLKFRNQQDSDHGLSTAVPTPVTLVFEPSFLYSAHTLSSYYVLCFHH